MKQLPIESRLFIGDDLTDESVFRALAGSGTGVVVAETDRPTAADLRLRNPAVGFEGFGFESDAAFGFGFEAFDAVGW